DAEARVRATLGNAYVGLALPERAEPQLRRALDLQRRLHPREDHPDVARAMTTMAGVLLSLNPARTKEAELLAAAALEMRRRMLGPDHKDIADSLDMLAAVCRVQRDYFPPQRPVEEAKAKRRP